MSPSDTPKNTAPDSSPKMSPKIKSEIKPESQSETAAELSSEAQASFRAPDQRFFGRRKGQALSQRKQSLMDDFLPTISVPVSADYTGTLDLQSLFPATCTDYGLEIGFGKGEHLAALAMANPTVGYIGCEPFINGVAGLLTKIQEEGIQNIRIYSDDARHVLEALPEASMSRVFLLHPDPWPKKRHARRRFVGPRNLDMIARVLKNGGEFRVGTDHPLYREWTAIQMANRSDFTWQVTGINDWLDRPDDWPGTRYEAKAIEGYPTYFRYKRSNR